MATNFQFSALWTISTHQQWKSDMSPVHILIGVKLLISENRPEVKIFYMNNDKCATVGACGSAWSCYWRRICTGQTRSSRERICLVTAVPRAMNYKYTYRCVAVALSQPALSDCNVGRQMQLGNRKHQTPPPVRCAPWWVTLTILLFFYASRVASSWPLSDIIHKTGSNISQRR